MRRFEWPNDFIGKYACGACHTLFGSLRDIIFGQISRRSGAGCRYTLIIPRCKLQPVVNFQVLIITDCFLRRILWLQLCKHDTRSFRPWRVRWGRSLTHNTYIRQITGESRIYGVTCCCCFLVKKINTFSQARAVLLVWVLHHKWYLYSNYWFSPTQNKNISIE